MAIKGDFISFTYNGVHSTDLGVMRVTSSNRYTDALLPTIQDKTVQAPGSNGTYFFGSYYTQRQITINVAFDEVTEDQIRLMRKIFGDQLSHELVFDDEPYKVYYAKSTGTPQLQYVPFSSPRVYKGEGTFTFTCFDPFAHTPNKYKYITDWVYINLIGTDFEQGAIYVGGEHKGEPYNDNSRVRTIDAIEVPSNTSYTMFSSLPYFIVIRYDNNMVYLNNSGWKTNGSIFGTAGAKYIKIVLAKNTTSGIIKVAPNDIVKSTSFTDVPWWKYNNIDEWNLGAGLLSTKGTGDDAYDTFNVSGFTNGFKLYNPGDVETDFKLIVDFNATLAGIKVATAFNAEALDSTLNIKVGNVKKNNNDNFLLFDSKTNIIYGLKSKNVNVKTGSVYNDWIKSGQWFKIPKNSNTQYGFYLINYEAKSGYTPAAPILQYDYLYF